MTPPLLEKSTQSMLIAKMLVKHNYSSSINRAYYSCLQYILHILEEKLKHTREEIMNQPSSGTHGKAQYLLESSLVSRVKQKTGNYREYKWFQEQFPALKQERVKADYYGDALNPDRGYAAIRTAEDIINTLRKYY